MSDAVSRYHDLLASDGLAAGSQEGLDRLQQSRGLYFGTRPVCSVLRPRFLTTEQYRFLRNRTKVLLPAFQTAYEKAMADPEFRTQFRLLDWEEQLLDIEPGFKNPSPTSRFDSFFVAIRATFRDLLGPDWTPAMEREWASLLEEFAATR